MHDMPKYFTSQSEWMLQYIFDVPLIALAFLWTYALYECWHNYVKYGNWLGQTERECSETKTALCGLTVVLWVMTFIVWWLLAWGVTIVPTLVMYFLESTSINQFDFMQYKYHALFILCGTFAYIFSARRARQPQAVFDKLADGK